MPIYNIKSHNTNVMLDKQKIRVEKKKKKLISPYTTITFKNKFYLGNSIIVHIDYKKHIC